MTDDWKPGDLALCVNTRDRKSDRFIGTAGRRFRVGAIYTVAGLGMTRQFGVPCLYMVEDPTGLGVGPWRFHKINPPTDAEREEFLRELNTTEKVSCRRRVEIAKSGDPSDAPR